MRARRLFSSGNTSNRFHIPLGFLALLLGALIYILFRSSEPVFFTWIPGIDLGNLFSTIRSATTTISPSLPEWVVYSLPGGLWAFGYAVLITGIWNGSRSWLRIFWMATIPVLVAGYEILQYAGIIPGVFSAQDIALGMAGLIIGIWIGKSTSNQHTYEKIST
jgi:hypothetical protein